MSGTVKDPIFDVKGKVVVLTGACGLIGRAIAHCLAERGSKLALIDIPSADPSKLAKDVGYHSRGYELDVRNGKQISDCLKQILKDFGRVDVLINNHQAKPTGFLDCRAETFPEELWDEVVDVNLKGTFLMCRELGREMLAQGSGSIINLASTYGVVSSNPSLYDNNSMGNPVAYSASKGGVIMLSQYLGCYWAKSGVRVNCITPHGVWNDHEEGFDRRFSSMSPMNRMMKPTEILGAILYLASDASSYTNASNMLVEGGWSAW